MITPWDTEDYAVERVEQEQVGERLAAQIQGEVVDQFLGWERHGVQQVRQRLPDVALVVGFVRQVRWSS